VIAVLIRLNPKPKDAFSLSSLVEIVFFVGRSNFCLQLSALSLPWLLIPQTQNIPLISFT